MERFAGWFVNKRWVELSAQPLTGATRISPRMFDHCFIGLRMRLSMIHVQQSNPIIKLWWPGATMRLSQYHTTACICVFKVLAYQLQGITQECQPAANNDDAAMKIEMKGNKGGKIKTIIDIIDITTKTVQNRTKLRGELHVSAVRYWMSSIDQDVRLAQGLKSSDPYPDLRGGPRLSHVSSGYTDVEIGCGVKFTPASLYHIRILAWGRLPGSIYKPYINCSFSWSRACSHDWNY